MRVERPRDVFNPSVLKVRWVPGVASYRTPYQQIGLSAPTSDRPEIVERNAPPTRVVIARILRLRRLG